MKQKKLAKKSNSCNTAGVNISCAYITILHTKRSKSRMSVGKTEVNAHIPTVKVK